MPLVLVSRVGRFLTKVAGSTSSNSNQEMFCRIFVVGAIKRFEVTREGCTRDSVRGEMGNRGVGAGGGRGGRKVGSG